MSKRKKQVYGCVITLAGLLAVLDQVTGTAPDAAGGPQTVLGSPGSSKPGSSRGEPPAALEDERAAVYVLAPARFPANLPAAGAGERDLFGLTEIATQALVQESSAAGDRQAVEGNGRRDETASLAEEFQAVHAVSAVMSDGALEAALVDGVWMQVGQLIDGCELVRISGSAAIFECMSEKIELSVGDGELSGDALGPGGIDDLKN